MTAARPTTTLATFLLARIAEDHTWAKRMERQAIRTHHVGRRGPHPPGHFSRVLADCEAKRRIVERCKWADGDPFAGAVETVAWAAATANLRDLASVYAEHPDYREEWRP